MAPPPHNHPQYRGQIEVGMHVVDRFPNEQLSTPTGPTVESMPREPSHNGRRTQERLKGKASKARALGPHPLQGKILRFVRWLQQSKNLALFLWLIPIVSGLLVQLLLLTGALDPATKTKERKKIWNEVVNQILHAFFTLGCALTHPRVFYQLILVIRWTPEGELRIRSIYCKNRTPQPRDRRHLLFVVCLLNLTWVGQYVMCALYWGFNRHNRPAGFLNFWLVATFVAPNFAFFYAAKGPLRADKIAQPDIEVPESKLKMYKGGVMVTRPEWDGGLFSCPAFFFFPFYAFGKNVNKLGFGSRNIHMVTFAIAVLVPFPIFYVTSLKVHSHAIKVILWTTGGFISWAGLLYGGYWRIGMREKYNLPENSFCFGVPFLTDYFQWLFCAPCSLAQEIRTANSYDIEE